MKAATLFIIFFLLLGTACDNNDISPKQSETFLKFYGGNSLDHGNDVKQLPDGGYFVIGTLSISENNTDVFVLITDKFGNSKTDVRTFGGPLSDKASKIQILSDGSAVAIGTYQKSIGNNDIWILRFNNLGDTLWTRKYGRSYGDDEGNNLIINSSDDIVAVGYCDSLNNGIHNKQIWVHNITLDGIEVWPYARKHGSKDMDEIANSIVEVQDGYIMIGTSNRIPSETNIKSIYLVKIDSTALHGYPTTIGGIDDYYGKMIKTLPDGNFIILGNSINTSTGTSNIILSKVDNELVELFTTKNLDDGENETSNDLLIKDNQIYILGTTFDPKLDTKKMLMIKSDNNGENPVFYKYGFSKEKLDGYGMDNTSDGGFILTGSNLLLFKIKDLNDF